jgi:hypothetical protein
MDADCTLTGYAEPIRRFTSIDRRTRTWRRRCELIALFAKQLPKLSAAQYLDVERLADLIVLAEVKRSAMLAGAQVDVGEMAKLENTISRLKWTLGLGKRKRGHLTPGTAEQSVALAPPASLPSPKPRRSRRTDTETAAVVRDYLAEKITK